MSSAFVAPHGVRPQQSAMLWLAARLGLHVRSATVARLLWLAAGTAVAAGPLIIWLAAALADPPEDALPVDALPTSTGLSLALVACPGLALVVWASRSLAPDRAALAEALRQVGAERAAAWLLPALRIAVAAGLGAVAGAVGQGILRTTVFRALPEKAPLRTALDAVSGGGWIAASAVIGIVLIAGALFAGGSGHRLAGRLTIRLQLATAKATQTVSAAKVAFKSARAAKAADTAKATDAAKPGSPEPSAQDSPDSPNADAPEAPELSAADLGASETPELSATDPSASEVRAT